MGRRDFVAEFEAIEAAATAAGISQEGAAVQIVYFFVTAKAFLLGLRAGLPQLPGEAMALCRARSGVYSLEMWYPVLFHIMTTALTIEQANVDDFVNDLYMDDLYGDDVNNENSSNVWTAATEY